MKPGPRLAVSRGDAQGPDESTEDAPNRRGGELPAASGEEDVLAGVRLLVPALQIQIECAPRGRVQGEQATLAELGVADDEPLVGHVLPFQVERLGDAESRGGEQPEQRGVDQWDSRAPWIQRPRRADQCLHLVRHQQKGRSSARRVSAKHVLGRHLMTGVLRLEVPSEVHDRAEPDGSPLGLPSRARTQSSTVRVRTTASPAADAKRAKSRKIPSWSCS
jgi:hypothetical protein